MSWVVRDWYRGRENLPPRSRTISYASSCFPVSNFGKRLHTIQQSLEGVDYKIDDILTEN